jgi:MFS family permease
MDRLAVCDLDAVLVTEKLRLDLKKSSFLYAAMLSCAMIAELLGGVVTDYLLRRTRNLQIARSRMIAVSWGFVVAGLVPAILVHDVVVGLAGFTVALFFLGVAIAPLWTATMDIAPNYAGSSSALMNAAEPSPASCHRWHSAGYSTAPAAGQRRSPSQSGSCCSPSS